MPFSQNDLIRVTREVEVTEGIVVGGARDRVYGTAITFNPGGNALKSGLNTGRGGVHSVRAGLRFADADHPSELAYLLHHAEIEDFMRNTFPGAAEEATGVSATWNNAGTHVDGSTGPTITAGAGAFNNLLGKEGLILETSDPTPSGVSAANLRPRAIKAVKSDGTQIDIHPRYVAGSVGQISEPLVAEGPLAADFSVGKSVWNGSIETIRSINLEFEYSDQPGGSFQMVRGLKAGTFKLGFDGKGIWTIQFGYVGMDFDVLTEATQGNGTVNANPGIDNPVMTSLEDLSYFLVNGTVQLAADNLTSFNLDGAGGASGNDEVAGSRNRSGVTVGDIDFNGSIKLLHEHDKAKLVQGYGHAGNLVPMDIKVGDSLGNYYWFRLPNILFESSGSPKPGAKGAKTDGTFPFMTQLGAGNIRTFAIQAFDAP